MCKTNERNPGEAGRNLAQGADSSGSQPVNWGDVTFSE